MCKWLLTTFGAIFNARYSALLSLDNTCSSGHVEFLEWTIDTFRVSKSEIRRFNDCLFKVACSKGHLNVAKLLHAKFGYNCFVDKNWEFVNNICQDGQVDIMCWILTTFDVKLPLRMQTKHKTFCDSVMEKIQEQREEEDDLLMVKSAIDEC